MNTKSQSVWCNAPSESALYGHEIRKIIKAPEGFNLVGIDQKSAQLSIAAYYANNIDYYTSVATGREFDDDGKYLGQTAHCVNARMFGMVTEEEWIEAVNSQDEELIHSISLRRKGSKGGAFAIVFGASGKKVAKTLGISEKVGTERRSLFLTQMGLDNVISTLKTYENMYPKGGGFYLPLAFGYWLWNNSSHKSVNTIVQGFEALAQKLAVIRFRKECERHELTDKVFKILDVHDEILLLVKEGYEKQAGKLAGDSYTWAAEQIFNYHLKNSNHFANKEPPKFSIDLNGGFKVGKTYADVH